MASTQRKPAAWGADRPSNTFVLAVERFEVIPPLTTTIQAPHVARRFRVKPHLAATIAPLIYGEARP